MIFDSSEVKENIPTNKVLLAEAAATREAFYRDIFAAMEGFSEDELHRMAQKRGYTYKPAKVNM